MTLAPWEYLFTAFTGDNFPDTLPPDVDRRASVLLVVLTILYNVRTRALHRHPPYLEMWEWLWWTGLITFSMLIIESLFVFDYFTRADDPDRRASGRWSGSASSGSRRFFTAYEARLARDRYVTRQRLRRTRRDDQKRPVAAASRRQQRRRR